MPKPAEYIASIQERCRVALVKIKDNFELVEMVHKKAKMNMRKPNKRSLTKGIA